ncbi:MAG: methyltransferase domain-containing protein [Beijerinckiaceae bacterium]|nr:methyltransferase domain-containing protein [Beijerinckiaceae bacterium]MCZ8298730.1 methyltransferase domain-containing protein [Beijerinckiaceae bacterium]
MIDPLLEAAVAALPEFYQPIYGHTERWSASRKTEDRVEAILPVVEAFATLHGRPPRILDIGCAQGYLALRLAESGALVLGIDNDPRNIRVCTLLAESHPHLAAHFEEAEAIEFLADLPEDRFDLVIGLSVMHHICHRIGLAATRRLVAGIATRSPMALFELALREEPLYWAADLPADPYDLLGDFRFLREIRQFPTHLSSIARPLIFCSNPLALVGDALYRIDSIRTQSVVGIHDGEAAGQAYIESGPDFLKHVTLRSLNWEAKRAELAREAAYLAGPDRAEEDPILFGHGATGREAWLRRSRLPGETLDIVKGRGEPIDAIRITRSILRQLARLEARGWYHGDVALWNVVLGPDGDARLIDFGALRREPVNCVWPEDLRLAFGQFLFDLTSSLPLRAFPVRRPRFRPSHLPFPFRDAFDSLLSEVPEWSAQSLLDRIDRALQQGPAGTVPSVETSLATALDEYVDRLGDTVEALRSGYVRQRDGLEGHFRWQAAMEGAHHQTRQLVEMLDERLRGLERAHHETRLMVDPVAAGGRASLPARLRRWIGW